MDERIKTHLQYLNRYYLLLCNARKISREEFLSDPVHIGSSERFLQLAIESCLNIGNRIISLQQFTDPVKPPESYADIFRILAEIGVVDFELSKRLVQMAKFRNRLVHLYWDIEKELVYEFLQKNLEDFVSFRDQIVAFLNQRQAGESHPHNE